MGKSDYLKLGDYNAQCYECGGKYKASELKRHWEGYYVCPRHWEPRQPQDFVRGVTENITPEWTQPDPANSFVTNSYWDATTTYAVNDYVIYLGRGWYAGAPAVGVPPGTVPGQWGNRLDIDFYLDVSVLS